MTGPSIKQPDAFIPLVMSVAALAFLLVHFARFGNVPVPDERAPARIFQLLLAAQLPIIAFFAIKWLPRAPKQAAVILALQAGAGIVAIATVSWLER
jgi:hypothetical protein